MKAGTVARLRGGGHPEGVRNATRSPQIEHSRQRQWTLIATTLRADSCPPLPPGGGEVMTLFGAVLFRSVLTVFAKLFIHSERIRASTLGDVERIKIYHVRSCSAQICSGSLI